MPKLYVANATAQRHQFTYWIPDVPRAIMQEIPEGSQIFVTGRDQPKEIIDAIIDQHRQYGIRTVAEAGRDVKFSGICYSIDKPVPLPILYELVERRRGVLGEQGRQLREEAAIATDVGINDHLERNQMPGRLTGLSMSVEEMTRDPSDDSPEISEGVRVTHNPEEATDNPRSRGLRRAASRTRGRLVRP